MNISREGFKPWKKIEFVARGLLESYLKNFETVYLVDGSKLISFFAAIIVRGCHQ